MKTDRQIALEKTEAQLARIRDAFEEGFLNISETEVDRRRYKEALALTSWVQFVQSADYNYFVARVLLAQSIGLYGLFAAQQCVENHLKAALIKGGAAVLQTHNLRQLLVAARDVSPADSILRSLHLETICLRFNPFYEMGRYPVHFTRPRDGTYISTPTQDILYLDYFVCRMRQEMPLQIDSWDILGNLGHQELELVREFNPEVYAVFVSGNLNFLP